MIVLLYGHLATKYGKRHELAIKTPAEAIRAFCTNYKTFREDIIQDGQAWYKVLCGAHNRSDELNTPSGAPVMRIVPLVAGSGSFGKIVLGAALIAVSYYLPGIGGVIAGGLGKALVLGGISGMLTKSPKAQSTEKPDNKPSYAFNGPVNTSRQGNPVPIVYARQLRVGSQVISAGLAAESI